MVIVGRHCALRASRARWTVTPLLHRGKIVEASCTYPMLQLASFSACAAFSFIFLSSTSSLWRTKSFMTISSICVLRIVTVTVLEAVTVHGSFQDIVNIRLVHIVTLIPVFQLSDLGDELSKTPITAMGAMQAMKTTTTTNTHGHHRRRCTLLYIQCTSIEPSMKRVREQRPREDLRFHVHTDN